MGRRSPPSAQRLQCWQNQERLGARFTFTIPVPHEVGTGAAADFVPSAAHPPHTDGERTRILVVGDDPQTLRFVYEDRRVTVAGRPLKLTVTEYELLRALSVNAGRILTCHSLLRQVWSRRDSGDHRLVHAYVKRLRRKLGDDASSPACIFNEGQVGYRMPTMRSTYLRL